MEQQNSDQSHQLNNEGNKFMQSGQFESAIEKFKAALQLSPLNASSYKNIGDCLSNLGNNKEALEHYIHSFELNQNIEALIGAGNMFLEFGSYHEVILLYKTFLAKQPDNKVIKQRLETIENRHNGTSAPTAHITNDLESNDVTTNEEHKTKANIYNSLPDFNPATSSTTNDDVSSVKKTTGLRISLPNTTERSCTQQPQSDKEQKPQLPASIIIPVYNQVELTKLCLEYLVRSYKQYAFEVIIIDNGSTDKTEHYLNTLPKAIKIIRNDSNLGFARACNQGAAAAEGKYLVFLNNDTIPQEGWIDELITTAESDSSTGVVSGKLLFPNGKIQHAGVAFHVSRLPYHLYMDKNGNEPYVNKQREFNAVTGACLLIKKTLFTSLGTFDEHFENGLEDIDLCLKVKEQGKKIVYNPKCQLLHFASRSSGRQSKMDQNRKLFQERWGTKIIPDDFKYLLEDNMELGADPDTGEFFYLDRSTLEADVQPMLQEANVLSGQGNIQKCYELCCKAVNKYPYHIESLKQLYKWASHLREEDNIELSQNRLQLLNIPLHE
ncbi:MAG: glycosyltransferase [Fibrobacteria bacterium]|nr:glycosyltransferase [Fibrobacteria bacterium]